MWLGAARLRIARGALAKPAKATEPALPSCLIQIRAVNVAATAVATKKVGSCPYGQLLNAHNTDILNMEDEEESP